MQYLKPVVAETSPNLYLAAKNANLNPSEITQVNQMSYTIKQHRELIKLNPDKARKEYDALDPVIQDQLKFMFKDADYLTPPPNAVDRVLGVVKAGATILASPLIGAFKLAGQYNRLINEPYKVARQVAQGAELFSAKTWTDAWDGKNQYDLGALKQVTDYYGKYDVEVAKGLLEGKTPGEIVQAHGTIDENLLESIKKAYNEPNKFKEVLDGVKYAQVSPGRDIARMLDDKGVYNGLVTSETKNVSGVLDFIYQIAVDPLTWITGGLSKGVTKGERLAQSIKDATNNGIPIERAVETVFQDPKLKALWDDGIGPALKKVAKSKTAGEKSIALDDIAKDFPAWNYPSAIKVLSDGKAFDAKSAQKFFENAGNVNLLLSGRVSGTTFMRTGIAVARAQRLFGDGLSRSIDNIFNNVSRTAVEREKDLEPITAAWLNNEASVQRLINPEGDLSVVLNANKEITRWKKIGFLASRSPAGQEIFVGKKAIETADNFTARARQILHKDLAQTLTVKFLEMTADEQIVLLRNLDASIMFSMGLGGHPKGTELIEKILQDKYGGLSGFATKKELGVNPAHARFAPINVVKQSDRDYVARSDGPIHAYQSTWAVGSLPYDVIGSAIWEINSKKNLISAIGGATHSDMSKKIVNVWSILTLFPRLGVRSAIDEATMYLLSAPTKDIKSFALREGYKLGNVMRAATGSKSSTGPIRQAIQKALKFAERGEEKVTYGKRPRYTHEEALTIRNREDILQAKADELEIDVAQLTSLEKRQAVGEHIRAMYGPYIKNDEDMAKLLQAFTHSPDALNSMAQSIVAATSMSGKYGDDVMGALITPSMLDRGLDQEAVKMSRGQFTYETGKLSERQVALAHWEKWYKMFGASPLRLPNERYLSTSDIFFKYNGLEPGRTDIKTGKEMFELALDEAMRKIGFEISPLTKTWRVADKEAVDEYKQMSSFNTGNSRAGLDDATIVRSQLFVVFADMFETFNGDPKLFNKGLMNVVKSSYRELSKLGASTGRRPYWNDAITRISLDEFHDATVGYRIKGEINSGLDFDELNADTVFQRYGNKSMEWMDQQVTGIFRQPAIMITYVKLRRDYDGIEREFVRQNVEKEIGPWGGVTYKEQMAIKRKWTEIGEKRFTELAVREAADRILKFADNPNVRSNFAFSMRTVGRYYRATEDFYRRIYRMKDVSPRVLARMRLVHIGIEASGMTHYDPNGEPYIVMPMDNIIFKATNGTLGILQGKGLSGYSQPSFSEFTMKLRMANPSFSQDAGLPTLSGPISGLSVVGIKNLLSVVPGKIPFIGGAIQPYAKQLGESIDTFALGNIGDNLSITKAIVPASLQRIWSALPFDEQNRQVVTAAQQAIAYNAAHGNMLNPNSTDQEKADYLADMRISAHNVLFMRHFLGLFSPIAPTTMESKGIPDYIKDTGITGLRSEFFDILNGISKINNGDIQDPYELALATYIGKNPGKLIYTVSREDKQTSVLIKNTDKLKSWGIRNEAFIKRYGEAAYIFAPQVGDFNASTYNWIQAAGLVESKSLENYYNDLLVATDKQAYYDVARQEKEILSTMSDPQLRANVIDAATNIRDGLKASNPLLNSALIGGGNTIGNETVLLTSIEQIIDDPNADIEPVTRRRMALATKMIRDFIAFASDPFLRNNVNATQMKAERKAQIEADLRELMLGDLYVTEANRAVFSSILGFYSRDSYYAFREIMK